LEKEDFMKDNALVSAIIPTYNRGYIVGKAIDSILAQTYKNIEIIVVDDGSTDDTQEKLEKYGERIRVVYQRNSGVAAARNCGIRASRGEIVAFLDSDDIWLPRKIEQQVSVFQRSGTGIVCCLGNGIQKLWDGTARNVFDVGLFKPTCNQGIWLNVTEILTTRFIVLCQLVAIRREVFDRMGYFDESIHFLEDHDLLLRLSIEGPWGFIREPLTLINANSADSLSLKVSKETVYQKQYILKSRERVYETLRNRCRPRTDVEFLRQAIKRARRDLQWAKLEQSNLPGARILGIFLRQIEHYRMAIFRRSPWFPAIKTVPIGTDTATPAPHPAILQDDCETMTNAQ
jgi:glycosyltransferase involved in cell wall biosynthesis